MSYPIFTILRSFAPRITLPFAAIIGFIGYNLENRFSNIKNPPFLESIEQKRAERLIDELSVGKIDELTYSLKDKKFVPKTIFEKNVSPPLLDDEDNC